MINENSDEKKSRFSVDDIFNLYKTEGRVDFSEFDEVEIREFFEYYKTHVNELDKNTQTEMLEQFLILGIPNYEESVEILKIFDDEQKSAIGEYIGRIIEPEKYLELFHDLWPYLSISSESKFKKRFIEDEPEHVLMVAPFVDLENYVVTKDEKGKETINYGSFNRYERWKTRGIDNLLENSFLGRYFDNFESAAKLMKVCLKKSDRFLYRRGIEGVIKHYSISRPYFLYHYLPELVEKGLMSRENAIKLFIGDRESIRSVIFSSSFYQTKEEKAEQKKISERAKEIFDTQEDYINLYDSNGLMYQFDKLDILAEKRGLNHVFGNFGACLSWLSREERILMFKKFVEQQIPIFYVALKLEMKEDEVKMLIRDPYLAYEIHYLHDFSDLEILVKMGMEKLALEILVNNIKEYDSSDYRYRLAQDIPKILSYFSSQNQERIINFINKAVPSAWIYNLDYAMGKNYTTFKNLLDVVYKDGWMLLANYDNLLYFIAINEKKGNVLDINKERLRQMAREVFAREPASIWDFYTIFSNLYSEEEIREFVRTNLEDSYDSAFLKRLLEKLDARDKEKKEVKLVLFFQNEIVEVIKKNPKSFWMIFEEIYDGWKMIKKLFEVQERFDFFFENISDINLLEILKDSDDFLLDIVKNKFYFEKFIKKVIEINDGVLVGSILKYVEKILNNHKKALMALRNKLSHSYPKESILSPKIFDRFIMVYDDLSLVLRKLCEGKKFLVFEKNILGLENINLADIVKRDLDEYAILFPDSLVDLKQDLNSDLYNRAINNNIRNLAFSRNKYGEKIYDLKDIEPATWEKIKNISPFAELENKTVLDQDYYELVLEKISRYKFFPLYKNRLEKIAKEEKKRNGPAVYVEFFKPEKEFFNLVSRLSIVESSPIVLSNTNKILSLEEDRQKEILEILDFLLRFQADVEFAPLFTEIFSDLNSGYFPSKKRFLRIALDYLAKIFDNQELSRLDLDKMELDVEVLRVLSTYYRRSVKNNRYLKNVFNQVIPKIISGEFEEWRARREEFLPQSLDLKQYEIWTGEEKKEFDEVMSLDILDVRRGIKRVLDQAAVDGHIVKDELNLDYDLVRKEYDKAFAPIGEFGRELQLMREALKEGKGGVDDSKLQKLQKMLGEYRNEHKNELSLVEAKLYLSHLISLSADGLSRKLIKVGSQEIAFSKAFKILKEAFKEKNPDFYNDILKLETMLNDAALKIFGGERVSRSKLLVTDKIDLGTYIKIGEFPVESCQNYNSESGLNFGLLSCVIDPNVKIIQIYDENKKIISRGVLRLMEDEAGSPALFMERIYSVNLHPKIDEAMINLAASKAEKMGIKLYSHVSQGISGFAEEGVAQLYNKGSRSSHVYTDAGGGLKRDGKFVISGAFRIG